MNPLTLKLSSSSQPVVLEMANGQPEDFELREMNAATRDKYMDVLSTRIGTENGEMGRVKRFEGMQAELLHLCLFRRKNGEAVKKEEIQEWPATAVNTLFRAAQQLNTLNAEAVKEAEKND